MGSPYLSPLRIKQLNAAVLGALIAILLTQCTPRLIRQHEPRSGVLDGTFVMTRTGGSAGGQVLLVVNQYGTYMVNHRVSHEAPTTGTLTATDLRALAKALNAADLDHRRSVYSNRCADQFHYTFSYGDAYYATDDCPIEPGVVGDLKRRLDPLIRLYESPG